MKLSEIESQDIGRGWVFRVPGFPPYEDLVDFMVVEENVSELSLFVCTGYKAGIRLFVFPDEAFIRPRRLSTKWVQDNIARFINGDIDSDSIEAFYRYPPGINMTQLHLGT